MIRPFLMRRSYCGAGSEAARGSVDEKSVARLRSELIAMVDFMVRA
jgi:hypothetical protein